MKLEAQWITGFVDGEGIPVSFRHASRQTRRNGQPLGIGVHHPHLAGGNRVGPGE